MAQKTITVSTSAGPVRVSVPNKVSAEVRKVIAESIRREIDEVHPIEELQAQLKKLDPDIDTPQAALITYMEMQKWTQKKLEKVTGIPQGHISEMKRGLRPIGKITAKKFAKAFEVDYRRFL